MTVRRAEWLCEPLPDDVANALDRLERAEDVVALAIMPDVHLAHDVCVGTVTATRSRLFPAAVGGDIGCGMQTMAFDTSADRLDDASTAARILEALYAEVPVMRHPGRSAPPLPDSLAERPLSSPRLEARKRREARDQLGTVGRGNHFVELQRDEDGSLWALVHTGSRSTGRAIRDHHLTGASVDPSSGLAWLPAAAPTGQAYLADAAWARAYAQENRHRILDRVASILERVLGCDADQSTRFDTDHNHVEREEHDGEHLWVHRKGAQAAHHDALGIVPGSMGSATFHVQGRGDEAALCSSAHGAGRAMSRTEARRTITRARFARETDGIWYDHRRRAALLEEAPTAYKDIQRVMRAQRDLVRIVRRLHPVLVFKGA